MIEPSPFHDPNPQLFVQEFDALADWAQMQLDPGPHAERKKIFIDEMEFTTEWQMEPSAEMAHSF